MDFHASGNLGEVAGDGYPSVSMDFHAPGGLGGLLAMDILQYSWISMFLGVLGKNRFAQDTKQVLRGFIQEAPKAPFCMAARSAARPEGGAKRRPARP